MKTLMISFAVLLSIALTAVLAWALSRNSEISFTSINSASYSYNSGMDNINIPTASMISLQHRVSESDLLILQPQKPHRKLALLIGLNYSGSANSLYGCIEDVNNLTDVLLSRGFTVEKVTDETEAVSLHKMQTVLATFFRSLQDNDMAVVWYSGHGTLLSDGQNAWVPSDYDTSGFLSESWILQEIFKLSSSVRLFCGTDACHSGSMLNLKYDIEPVGTTIDARRGTSIGRDIQVLSTSQTKRRDFSYDIARRFEIASAQVSVFDVFPSLPETAATIVVLAGCSDTQTSADAYIQGETQGAMTFAFLKAVDYLTSSISLATLQSQMRSMLQDAGYAQIPQLSISKKLNPSTPLSAWGF